MEMDDHRVLKDDKSRVVSTSLCNTCQGIFRLRSHWRFIYEETKWSELYKHKSTSINTHHPTFESFSDAVRNGCYICVLLREANPEGINEIKNKGYSFSWQATVDREGEQGTREAYMVAVCMHQGELSSFAGPDDSKITANFSLWRPKEVSPPPLPLASGWTVPSTVWEQIKAWVHECTNSHKSCMSYTVQRDGPWYPTRLLDLYNGHDSNSRARLVETKNKEDSLGPYITLSHCWGDPNHVPKLTRQNYSQFEKEIPSLPKTFEDAIAVARKLNIRYLWIDSLCIIQDKGDLDWVKESAVMHNVYLNALFNIAATASADSHGGLFFPNRPDLPSCEVLISAGKGEDRFLLLDDDLFKREVLTSPLLKRGWVFQERLLAPRILHFGKMQVFWECNQHRASESLPNGIPRSILRERTEEMFEGRKLIDQQKRVNLEETANWVKDSFARMNTQLWHHLVEAYTEGAFTYPSDKLTAFSGVAQYFQPTAGDTYLAGIWKKDLKDSLAWSCWQVPSSYWAEPAFPRPKEYRAPTWSWASTDNAIFMPHNYGSSKLKILHAQTDLATSDPFGAVSGGYLEVEGPLYPVTVKGYSTVFFDGNELHRTYIYLDEPLGCPPLESKIEGFLLPLRSYSYDQIEYVNWTEERHRIEGLTLLLLKASITEPGSFVRLGLGDARHEDLKKFPSENKSSQRVKIV